MKIVEPNAGVMTNCELLANLRASQKQRERAQKHTKGKKREVPQPWIERKVEEYLARTAAAVQTPKALAGVLEMLDKTELSMAEKLSLINQRPQTLVELYLILEKCGERFSEQQLDDLLAYITDVLPPPPVVAGEGEEPGTMVVEEELGEEEEELGEEEEEEEEVAMEQAVPVPDPLDEDENAVKDYS